MSQFGTLSQLARKVRDCPPRSRSIAVAKKTIVRDEVEESAFRSSKIFGEIGRENLPDGPSYFSRLREEGAVRTERTKMHHASLGKASVSDRLLRHDDSTVCQ